MMLLQNGKEAKTVMSRPDTDFALPRFVIPRFIRVIQTRWRKL